MADDGWISIAIMALAAVVAGLANILAFIATSNTNNMLGAFIRFIDVAPPIPTADEKILHELYLLSLLEWNTLSGGFPPEGAHHPPPASDMSAGGFNFLPVLYYLALTVLVLYPLVNPFVRGLVRKRAKAKADSEEEDVIRLLQSEKMVNEGLIRENNDLKQGFEAQEAINRANHESLESLNMQNTDLSGQFKGAETQMEEANVRGNETVRYLIKEN